MPRFVPQSFQLTESLIEWAKEKFNIDDKEVERQFELMQDHEFRRNYTDWNRVFRNWIRKAEEIGSLKREHKPREAPGELTSEERQRDIDKFHEDMKRFKVVK